MGSPLDVTRGYVENFILITIIGWKEKTRTLTTQTSILATGRNFSGQLGNSKIFVRSTE